jgi:two-component system sensor histidine kinase KdpD
VDNLLDMSRLQAGVMAMAPQPISLAKAIPTAVDDLGEAGRGVTIHVPRRPTRGQRRPGSAGTGPGQPADQRPALQPTRPTPIITASEHGGRVEVRVVDHGPGVPTADWDCIFAPFQRLGDRDNATGVGLGLALSRGLVEAMGGTLTPEATRGGGLTMTISLPAAPAHPDGPGQAADPAILDRLDRWPATGQGVAP